MTLRQTAKQPQWLEPCGYVVIPSFGRSIHLADSEKQHRGRWRG